MKNSNYFIFIYLFILIFSVYSYDFIPLGFSIEFPSDLTIESTSYMRVKDTDGKGYQLVILNEILFNNQKIEMLIHCLIDDNQIPYNNIAKNLLQAYYTEENHFNVKTLIPEDGTYFDSLVHDMSFSKSYRARGLQLVNSYKSDIIYGQNGTRIERDYSRMYQAEPGASDKLSYYFKDNKSLYSEYIIEVYDIWHFSWEYRGFELKLGEPKLKDFSYPGSSYISINELHTMTNEELKNYPDQNNPSIRLMHLLNEAMSTLRFNDRLNIPDSNLGTVNDNRVRVRTEYNLSSETIGHVNTGEEVIVMERSPEKQKIGDMEDFWYRILSKSSYIKGWMYGAFLDLDAKEIDNK